MVKEEAQLGNNRMLGEKSGLTLEEDRFVAKVLQKLLVYDFLQHSCYARS